MSTTPPSFGNLLRTLRKRVGMTQGDLAAAVGYSAAAISALEQERRLPAVDFVVQHLVPALALTDAPQLATRLVELAAALRGERPPTAITVQRTAQIVIQEEVNEPARRLPTLPTVIGRTTQVQQLCDRLLGHGGRLLSLIGPPGIGKTTLALAVAGQMHDHYRDGVVFVALAAITEPTVMAATIATAVGCSDSSAKPPQIRLIEFLRRKTMLLVLDNLEQLLPHPSPPQSGEGADKLKTSVGLIAALVTECPGVCVLATSRERLHLRIEQRFKVPPLDLVPAVELFVQRAQAVDADFCLTPQNQQTIKTICQQLDCLPLALELCAAQIDMFAPTQLLAQLQERRLDLLGDGPLDLPTQHRTLRAAIQRSYDLLNEAESSLFRTLGVFLGGFALPEVAAVMAEGLETREWRVNDGPIPQSLVSNLHSLIGKSLVRAETTATGEPRFMLLETIREFALEQVRAHGEEASLRQRHYASYLHLFRTGDSYLRGPEASVWFVRLAPEQDNLRATLQWALDEARYADVVWLLIAAFWFWFVRGQWYEQGHWIAQLLPYRQKLDPDLYLALLINLYSVERAFDAFVPVERWEDEVRQLFALNSHPLLPAAALYYIAGSSHTNMPKAAAAWEESIALARAAAELRPLNAAFGVLADREFRLGKSLCAYAERLVEFGQFTQISPMLNESLAIFQVSGSRYEISNCLGVLGRMALLQGDMAQAYRFLSEAVALAMEFNYHEMLGWLQGFLGLATFYHGERAEARRILEANHRFCTGMKAKGLTARNAIYLAEIYLGEGLVDEAFQCLRQGTAFFANLGWVRVLPVEHFLVAARLAAARQHYQRAAMLFGLVEQICRRIDYVVTGPRRSIADAAQATVQRALGATRFAEIFIAGQQMTLEQAFATILLPSEVEKSIG